MKTRYKITIIAAILVVSFFVWPIPYNEICRLNNYDSCGTISAFGIPGVGLLRYDSLSTGNPNECWYQEDDGEMLPCMVGGGAVDLDPKLSPSYAYDFMGGLFYHTILPITGWVVGISALFLVPYFILKRKNIPSKPYLSIILAVLLLFFALPNFIASLQTLAMIFSAQPENMIIWVFDPQFVVLLIPIIVLIIAGILLYRSTVIRKLIKR